MPVINVNQVVSIHYTLTNDAGEVIDSSRDGEPLLYLHGHGNIIPGLENALEGLGVGDTLKVTVAPAEAYGERDDEAVFAVPRSELPPGFDAPEGEMVRAQAEDGSVQHLIVLESREDEVLFDGNHPLAGETLHFDVEIIDLRPATREEQSHGHVHGPDGHHHH